MAFLDSIKKFVFPAVEDEEPAMEPEIKSVPKPVKEETPSFAPSSRRAKVVSLPTGASQKIIIIKLDSNNDVKVIIDHLKEKTPVIFNIARLDRNEATRAVDVVYGASYAVDGSMQKVSNDIFVVTPAGVEIAGDITEQLMDGAEEFSLDI